MKVGQTIIKVDEGASSDDYAPLKGNVVKEEAKAEAKAETKKEEKKSDTKKEVKETIQSGLGKNC